MKSVKMVIVALLAALLLTACGGEESKSGKPKDIRLDYQVGEIMVLEMQGNGTSWDWYRDGVRLTSSARIAPTPRSLTVRDLGLSDSGKYWATYMDMGKSRTTNKVIVTVSYAPVVLEAFPESSGVVMGETTTLVAPVVSGAALSYQWYRDSTILPDETDAELSLVVSEETIAGYSVHVSNPTSDAHSTAVQLVEVDQYATGYWWTKKGTIYSDIVVEPSGEFWMVMEDVNASSPYILFQRGNVSTWSGSWSLQPREDQSSLFYWQTPASLSYSDMVLSDAAIQQQRSLQGQFAYLGLDEVLDHGYQTAIVNRQVALSDLAGAWSHPDLTLSILADGALGTNSFLFVSDCLIEGAIESVEGTEYLYRLSAQVVSGPLVCAYSGGQIDGVGTLTPAAAGLDFTLLYGVSHGTTGEILLGLLSNLRR